MNRHSGQSQPSRHSSRQPFQHTDRYSGLTEVAPRSEKTGRFDITLLWRAPAVNAITGKARSIPILNPINLYGRVFHFAWFGFFVAFWSWYAFPPLLTITIAKDVGLTSVDIMNSNITALVGTLLVRLTAGLACDRFGARYVFAAILFAGAIPTVIAGAVTSASGLIAVRFFVGILGGAFVPCQVWTAAFFDKNVVGTATSLTAGWGNSGGGITYFIMPAIFDSLIYHSGYTAHTAWRVAFIVPFLLIVVTAASMILLCPDTPLPQGNWGARHSQVQRRLAAQGIDPAVMGPPGIYRETKIQRSEGHNPLIGTSPGAHHAPPAAHYASPAPDASGGGVTSYISSNDTNKHLAELRQQEMIDAGRGETVQSPSRQEAAYVAWSAQTLVLVAVYFCTFGSELAVNSILGAFYLARFTSQDQTSSGRWAAMFGLLNIVTRPLGGAISDALYRWLGTLWAKKIWMHALGITSGVFLIIIGIESSTSQAATFGLVAGAAVFIEAGNGAVFSLVPHVHPFANGIVSGLTGAMGNLGGIVFASLFRAYGADYDKVFWVMGIMIICINLSVCWIRPVPVAQIGGR